MSVIVRLKPQFDEELKFERGPGRGPTEGTVMAPAPCFGTMSSQVGFLGRAVHPHSSLENILYYL